MTGTDPRRRGPRLPRRSAPGEHDTGLGPVLDHLAAIGPHFTLHHGSEPPGPPLPSSTEPAAGETDPAFHPLADLRGALLADTAADIGRRIGTTDPRVGASTLHLGLAARLWSAALGCAVLAGRVPDLAPH
ncbi:hypothetical protein FNQ90_25595, partial [Streptomyces alkaliphilus]|nr:hypothetical protein [Streptomyces alkaliphilus]